MKVYQIIEAPDTPNPSGSQIAIQKVGNVFNVYGPDGKVIGSVKRRDQAVIAKTKLNRALNKYGVDSPQFNRALGQITANNWFTRKINPIGMTTGKPQGIVGKTVDKVPGTKIGAKILAVASRTTIGKIVFMIMATKDILNDADGWAKAYMANGCKVNKQTDAYEVKIKKTVVENVLFFATGVTMAATNVIGRLGMLLALLPVAGWIATALAWVGSAVLASIIAKLLSKSSVAEWIADNLVGTMFGPAAMKWISFPECPNESLREDWERGILEDIAQIQEKRKATSNVLAKKAAAEIKDTFLSDPELMKVIKATKKAVDAGKIDKLPKGGKQAAQAIKAKAS